MLKLYEESLSSQSISRKLSALKTYYNFLVEHKYIDRNIFQNEKGPKQSITLPKFLSINELNQIINSYNLLTDTEILVFELLYETGIRVSELINIKIKDIDISNKQILVHGKGNKERTVFFTNYVITYINMSKGKIYLLENNGKQLTRDKINYLLKNIAIKCRLDKNLTPHMLRHTFATHLITNGISSNDVKLLLGHENLNTTSKYTHILNSKLIKEYEKNHPRNKKIE